MISKSNEFARRVLNFPAIRPCESVSFSTLLTSLINLSHTICSFKSKTFFTNKKNTRVSIHLIETLVVFLEEIRNGSSRFEVSLSLCLSELHFIFQKIHFLLEDCVRDDSRLLMLMKSDKISSHFRELMRGIALALDVLPLSELDIALEVKEMVEFVRKQALKTGFEVEKDDRISMRRILRIIHQFEHGIGPELSDLKRVLEYLEIRSGNECNKEVKFLENEIVQECEKRDLGFLSSLMAFMIYCRCSVFLNLESSRNTTSLQQSGGGSSREMIKCLNPDDFRCPISLEIMSDPVIISTGHTYDRCSILKWFKSGNHTCPKTGERLICVDPVPNHALKRIIKQYCQENGILFGESDSPNRESTRSSSGAGSPAAEQAMKLVANFLVQKLLEGTSEEKNKAAYEVRLLTKTRISNRSCLVEADAIPPLLNLLSSIYPEAQDNAIAGLMNLSKFCRSKKIIVENGGLTLIVDVLKKGIKMESRQHAAGALFYLTSVEEYRKMIGRIPEAIPGLMELLQNGPNRAKKNALVTFLGLLMYQENHWRVLSAGLVLLLVNLLTSCEREDLISDLLAVLATLAEKLDGAMAIISADTLPIIIDILGSSNSRTAKEYCVSILLSLCINEGADVVPLLVKNTSLMMFLYSLLADGTSRSSKKASSLIRILHAFNEKSSSGSRASTIPQEQFVHVW
ncbi:Ubiquitin--protein ligase [Handroanthus impetiginosus]|uniref:RING-type E3 ubiquitin transferase n=1 Tax=Handroanthus impetiginosus TaxID=429701 RepID=A0A2G9GYJ9_9LAMI|nr:Ubiquitin--protein ligase [Handroanthus impetiginosus]